MNTGDSLQSDAEMRLALAAKLKAHCEACLPMMETFLAGLVELDTPSDDLEANQRCLLKLHGPLRSLGFEVTEVPSDEGPVHLFARRKIQADAIPVILVGHVDTVHIASESFSGLQVDGGLARGPGVAGMKGGLIVMLVMLDALSAIGVLDALDVRVLINSDEEQQSFSSRDLVLDAAAGAEIALVFEAARPDGGIVGSRRATGRFRFDITGEAAHGSVGHADGKNAILEAAMLVQRIEAMSDPERGITFNCGVIEGGTHANVVAATAILEVDARCDRAQDVGWIETSLAELASTSLRGCAIAVSGQMGRPAWPESFDTLQLYDIWLEAADDLGLGSIELTHAGGGSDANNLHGQGLAVLDGLGPVGGGYHTQDEWVDLSTISERASMSALAILMWLHRRSQGIWSPGG
jgi:glutamate carboxypeptidase